MLKHQIVIGEALRPVPPTRNIEWLSGYKVWWVGVLGRGLKGRAIAEPKDRSIESLTCQVEGCFKDDVGRARFEGTIDGSGVCVCGAWKDEGKQLAETGDTGA